MDEREKKILAERIFPQVREMGFPSDGIYELLHGCKVCVETADPEGTTALVQERFSSFWQTECDLSVAALEKLFAKDEHYEISVTEDLLTIRANGKKGVNLALYTLRQLAEVKRNTPCIQGYFLPVCRITDEPVLDFRAIHLCVFPETAYHDIERKIRLAAYHKYNHAVIEFWGTYAFDCFPALGWAGKTWNKAMVRRLVRLGRSLGIELCPQLNLLGHASYARGGNGKHTVLDFHRQYESLFEPDGWCWCLSNPHTRELLHDVVLELVDLFERPAYFHIGCDEAHNFATCLTCRRSNKEDLLAEHISYFQKLLAAHGIRTIMWHDMLLVKKEGCAYMDYYANGKEEDGYGNLLSRLSREILIADWQYGYPRSSTGSEPDWPTNAVFKEKGFDVAVCPWNDVLGIRSMGKWAQKRSLAGYIQTTWNLGWNYPALYTFFGHGIQAAWGPEKILPSYNACFVHRFRQISQDMGIDSYEEAGFTPQQYMPRPS